MSPAGGFNGGLVTEVETLCFYNSTLWTPSLIPPAACINAPLTVFPGSLTYPSQSVNSTSATQTVIVKNSGNVAVTIGGIVASGDFYQQNNCPASLAAGAYLNRQQVDRAYVYRPSQPKSKVVAAMVRDFVNRVFNGSAEPLLVHLIEDRRLTADEIEEIRRLIGERP
jgi:hypothetical protein